jgi:hypothetical protein
VCFNIGVKRIIRTTSSLFFFYGIPNIFCGMLFAVDVTNTVNVATVTVLDFHATSA